MTTTDRAPLDVDEIVARCDAATPGPWQCDWSDYASSCLGSVAYPDLFHGWLEGHMQQADAAFIVAAREDVPALVAEVRRLQKELSDLQFSVEDQAYLDSDYSWESS